MSHMIFIETTGLGVQAIRYAKSRGHTVTFLWSPLYEFTAPTEVRDHARALADHTIRVDDIQNLSAPLAALRASRVKMSEVDSVLTTLSYCTGVAATLAESLGTRATAHAAVESARDKARCRHAMRDAGIPSLDFAVVRTADQAIRAADRIGYPVIVKPTLGIGKSVTTIAESPSDIQAHFDGAAASLRALAPGITAALDDRYIVEELANGDLYSVEVATDGHTYTPLVAVGRKTALENPVLELGCTVPCGLDEPAEAALGAYAVNVCRTLGLDLGIFHVEVMRTPTGFRLIEVNPRITGGSLPDTINAVAEADVFAILVDLFAGHPVPPHPLRLTGAASHSFLAAERDAVLPDDLPANWFDEFRTTVHSGYAHVSRGDAVRQMRGNFDSFGMLRAVAADPRAAEELCVAAKQAVERRLGIPLLKDQTQARLTQPTRHHT